MFTLLSVLLLLGKEFRLNKHANFCLLSLFIALTIQRDHIQVSVGVLLHPCLKEALFKWWLKKKTILHIFSITNVKC